MGMAASQARYLALCARRSDLEFQGQQINQSRTTLSDQTNTLYSQLQNLSVPTPPHTSDFTEIRYSGALGADRFTLGAIVPSGSSYTVNLDYQKAGNSTYSVGKAEVKDTPQQIYAILVDTSATQTVASGTAISAATTVENETQVLHKVSNSTELSKYSSARVFVMQTEGNTQKFIEKDASNLTSQDYNLGVYVLINAENDTDSATGETIAENYTPGVDYKFDSEHAELVGGPKSYADATSYYVSNGQGGIRRATNSDYDYDQATGVYKFKTDVSYYKTATEGTQGAQSFANPDYQEGMGKSLNGNPLMEASAGMDSYLTPEQKASAIEALRNGFPEYGNLEDDELLNLFYVSFSTEGSLKIPHFTLKTEIDTPSNGSQTQWAEYHDITSSGTYTKTTTYDNCQLTFDTSGRITKIEIPVTGANGEVVYHSIELTANTVTDEQAYEDAYNEYEYAKYEYDQEQTEINAQISIIQAQDKKLELKLQRLDNERTQIQTEIEALEKVIGDNIEGSYKTFSG